MVDKIKTWLPVIIVAFILFMTLPFKFGGAPETNHIFDTVGQYLGLDFFRNNGAYIIGGLELIAGVMILLPAMRHLGAALATGLLSGAIFFHLASPLGTTIRWMEDGVMQEDADMFIMAIVAWACAAWVTWIHRSKLPIIGGMGADNSEEDAS